MKKFAGKALFLNRSDISTDDIIPAKYLEETSKQALKSYIFEDLNIDGFNPKVDIPGKHVIITRENFGCGTTESKAVQTLEANEFYAVVAVNFAKSFRESMFSTGLLPVEINKKEIEDMFRTFAEKDTDSVITINDDNTAKVKLISGSLSKSYIFKLGNQEKDFIDQNKWIGAQ